MVQTDRQTDHTWQHNRPMRFTCWVTMTAETLKILTAFPRQTWLPKRAAVLRLHARRLVLFRYSTNCIKNKQFRAAWGMSIYDFLARNNPIGLIQGNSICTLNLLTTLRINNAHRTSR
jgi:hypothetical protein